MSAPSKLEARRQQIVKAAERTFAQKGFQEATISDVAAEAGVSEATIYEYFNTKEALLFSIPGETISVTHAETEKHMALIRGSANRLRALVYLYLNFFQTHPDYSSVAMLILKTNRKFLETEAYQQVRDNSRFILKLVREGIESGELRPETDPHLVRTVLLGTIEHLVIRWVMLGLPKKLIDYADPICELVFRGILAEPA